MNMRDLNHMIIRISRIFGGGYKYDTIWKCEKDRRESEMKFTDLRVRTATTNHMLGCDGPKSGYIVCW